MSSDRWWRYRWTPSRYSAPSVHSGKGLPQRELQRRWQQTANRANAQNSTGLRTAEGKSVSRFNALKHGIDAKSQCIPGESIAALDQLAAEYHARYAPAAPEERALVDTLVSAEWELRRLRKASAEIWEKGMDDNDDLRLADAFNIYSSLFVRLQRIIDSTQRTFRNALKDLEALRKARRQSAQPADSKGPTMELASFRQEPSPAPVAPQLPQPAAALTPPPVSPEPPLPFPPAS